MMNGAIAPPVRGLRVNVLVVTPLGLEPKFSA
jgi:hypothetical protein